MSGGETKTGRVPGTMAMFEVHDLDAFTEARERIVVGLDGTSWWLRGEIASRLEHLPACAFTVAVEPKTGGFNLTCLIITAQFVGWAYLKNDG